MTVNAASGQLHSSWLGRPSSRVRAHDVLDLSTMTVCFLSFTYKLVKKKTVSRLSVCIRIMKKSCKTVIAESCSMVSGARVKNTSCTTNYHDMLFMMVISKYRRTGKPSWSKSTLKILCSKKLTSDINWLRIYV